MSLSFGAPSSAPATGGLSGGFSFGSTQKPGAGFSLSQPPVAGFSTASAAPTLGFGATTSTAPGFGAIGSTGLSFSSATTTTPGLGFGTPISSATTTGLNLNASAAPSLGGFNFSAPSLTSAPSVGFGLLGSTNTTATSTASLFGPKLGATTTTVQSSSSGAAAEQQPKQQKLPNEISSAVDAFTEFVKRQKSLSSDVMRVSVKPLVKVSQQAEETIRSAQSVGGEAGRARAQARRLRSAAARALATAEQASRDEPDEGWRSLSYVQELVAELETQLMTCRRQTEAADRQMNAPQRPLTQQELSVGLRRMHESLVALAGRLQAVHAHVQQQRRALSALPGVEDELDAGGAAESPSRKRSSRASAVLSDISAALGSLQQATGPTPFTYLGTSLSVFPAAEQTGAWTQPSAAAPAAATVASSSFQLQKPPKRGKQ